FIEIIKSSWSDFSPPLDAGSAKILCLGLGSPSASQNARVQLAFLTETCKRLNVAHDSVSIYDPVFNAEDTALLEELHMTVLTKNNVDDEQHQLPSWYTLSVPTICFMPHCDIELYDAIIRANWSEQGLSNLFLLGNSLQEYLDNKPTSVLEAQVPSLLRAAPIFENKPLPPSTAWPTAFNNTSVQYFRPSKGTTFDSLFPEPEVSASSKEAERPIPNSYRR
ncbi:SRR1-domain-containing protein, partial [Agrocybe pediades]